MSDSIIKEALSLTFCETKLSALKEDQQKIHKGLYFALKDENVRIMLQTLAKENGVMGRRFINGYLKDYIKTM